MTNHHELAAVCATPAFAARLDLAIRSLGGYDIPEAVIEAVALGALVATGLDPTGVRFTWDPSTRRLTVKAARARRTRKRDL